MKFNICVYCGEQKQLYQNYLCRTCLHDSMQRGTKTINDVRPVLSANSNVPEDAK